MRSGVSRSEESLARQPEKPGMSSCWNGTTEAMGGLREAVSSGQRMPLRWPGAAVGQLHRPWGIKAAYGVKEEAAGLWQLTITTFRDLTLNYVNILHTYCVATIQGQASSWYSCRWKNIHRAVGMPGTPLFTGGWARHAANCMSPCMSHMWPLLPSVASIVATVPLCVTSGKPLLL